jgi:hypothetical protein
MGLVLQLLLILASAVILGSESRGTHDHLLLSQIRGLHNFKGQVPVFISSGKGWRSYTPRHLVIFSSPPTTRRATVEVFERFCLSFRNPSARTAPQKHSSFTVWCIPSRGNVFTQMFHSNGCKRHNSYRDNSSTVACWHYLATAFIWIHSSCFEQILYNSITCLNVAPTATRQSLALEITYGQKQKLLGKLHEGRWNFIEELLHWSIRLHEAQVPLGWWVAPGNGPFPGLRGGYAGSFSHDS